MNGDCKRDRCRFRHPGTYMHKEYLRFRRKDNVLMGIEKPYSPAELKAIMKRYSPTLTPLK